MQATRSGWQRGLEPVVRGMAEAILSEELGSDDPGQMRFLDEVTDGLLLKLSHMPQYLGIGMILLSTAFDLGGTALGGRPFHLQPMDRRRRQIALWKKIPVGLLAQYTTFYEKMTLFTYYSLLEESMEGGHA